MSILCGKCDLYDHISGLGGWYDRDGNKVKFGQEGVGAYYSDFYQDFVAFKEATGGILRQHIEVKNLTEYSIHELTKNYPDIVEIVEHKTEIEDKRKKSGKSEKITYTYKYFGKEYTLKELNKHGVCVPVEVHFSNPLELIPYLPYIVKASSSANGKQTIFIGNESYAETEAKDRLRYGGIYSMVDHYRRELADLYLYVCKNYMLYKLEGRTRSEVVESSKLVKDEDGNYSYYTTQPIDSMHSIEYSLVLGKTPVHWTSPQYVCENKIKLSKVDVENYLSDAINSGNLNIEYVAYPQDGFPVLPE